MDSENILRHARARFDHESARRILREKYQARLIFGHGGGMFRATPELILWLESLSDGSVILEDLYQTPVQVVARDLANEMRVRYAEQMNAWLQEYQELQQQR